MPTTTWIHGVNFFIPMLIRSNVGSKAIIDLVDAKLHNGDADAAILVEYNDFHPLCLLYDAAYLVWDSLRNSSSGNTLGVVQVVEQLSSIKIREWDIIIQGIYAQTTSRYMALLPHRRIPFQSGSVASRQAAIANLLIAIGTDAALAALKINVLAFQTLLTNAKTVQAAQMQSIDSALTALEIATGNCADAMFGVFGGLVKKYKTTPDGIQDYFPIELMNAAAQTDYVLTLVDMIAHFVCKRKQNIGTDMIRGVNSSTNAVKLFYTNGVATTPRVGAPFVLMPPESDALYNPADMGYTDAKRNLYAQNMDSSPASIQVSLL